MNGMMAYFARRLFLVPITFIVITLMVYTVLRFVPGGPIEQAETAMKLGAKKGEGSSRGSGLTNEADLQLDEDSLLELQRYYALDKPVLVGYGQWLGVMPREIRTRVPQKTILRETAIFGVLTRFNEARVQSEETLVLHLESRDQILFRNHIYQGLEPEEPLPEPISVMAEELRSGGFAQRDAHLTFLETHGFTWDQGRHFQVVDTGAIPKDAAFYAEAERLRRMISLAQFKLADIRKTAGYEMDDDGRVYRITQEISGIFQLDFGRSYTHGEPVISLIGSKMEVSIQFGLIGYLLSWLICVPLGVFKAIQHRSVFDTTTSLLVFVGYAMPGFVVCLVLLSTLALNVDWIPLGGYKPDNIDEMQFWEAIWGRIRHMLIPVIGYMIGGFATMTILMKNTLLDNLGADYVRTGFAKGLRERRVIFVHALRNSLIPITAGIGHAIGLLFAGSFLIEKTCNIDGMGLLGFNAILQRDYPIIMATLVFGVLVQLFGNIISDIVWAMIDPRIRFG